MGATGCRKGGDRRHTKLSIGWLFGLVDSLIATERKEGVRPCKITNRLLGSRAVSFWQRALA